MSQLRKKLEYLLSKSDTFLPEVHKAIIDLGASTLQMRLMRNGQYELSEADAQRFLEKIRLERPGYTNEKYRVAPPSPNADGISVFSDLQLAGLSAEMKIKLGNRLGPLERGSDGLWRKKQTHDDAA